MDIAKPFKEVMDEKIHQLAQSFMQSHPNHRNNEAKKSWIIRALWKVLEKTQKLADLDIQFESYDDKQFLQLQYDQNPSPIPSNEKYGLSKSHDSKEQDEDSKNRDLIDMARLEDIYEQNIVKGKYDERHRNNFQIFKESSEQSQQKLDEELQNSRNQNKRGIININEFQLPKKHEKEIDFKRKNQGKQNWNSLNAKIQQMSQRECKKKIKAMKDVSSSQVLDKDADIKIEEASQFSIYQESNQKSETIFHKINDQTTKMKKYPIKAFPTQSKNKVYSLQYQQYRSKAINKLKIKEEDQSSIQIQSLLQEDGINRTKSMNQRRSFKFSNKGRKPEYPQMQKRLIKWIRKQINEEIKVTQAQIRIKAIQIMTSCQMYEGKTFRASKGWMQKFFRRHSHIFELISMKSFRKLVNNDAKIIEKVFAQDDI